MTAYIPFDGRQESLNETPRGYHTLIISAPLPRDENRSFKESLIACKDVRYYG